MAEQEKLAFDLSHVERLPGLLVSVRNGAEAVIAVDAGADVIDVKEPDKGPLGGATPATIQSVVETVAGRVPVTAALGELAEWIQSRDHSTKSYRSFSFEGISLFKMGLAGCGGDRSWRQTWADAVSRISAMGQAASQSARPVAVVYADWKGAMAPEPTDVLDAAAEMECPALLIDTWNKSAGMLFDYWPVDSLSAFLEAVRRHEMRAVLAGSLTGENAVRAAALGPDLIAVRGAACSAGRNSTVCAERVRELKRTVERCNFAGQGR